MRIEYEDEDILVVYKEAGIPVQAGRVGAKDLVSILKNYLAGAVEISGGSSHRAGGGSGEPYLGIVHRLDQPVEGLLVFAKTPKAAAALSRQAAGRDMRKVYQAGVDLLDDRAIQTARLAQKKVVRLTDYLARDYKTNSALVVPEGTPDSKLAELTYRTLELTLNSQSGAAATRDGSGTGAAAATAQPLGHAVLEIHLQTGRHHQIRVQLAHAGLPLSGDRKYNPSCAPYLNAGAVGADINSAGAVGADSVGPLQLCAVQLQFLHPTTHRKMKFQVTPSWR